MLVTPRDDVAEKVRLLRSHGMTTLTWDRHQGHAYSYDVIALGYNYRIDEIHSALGLAQLAKLPSNNARRGEIAKQYWKELSDTKAGLPFRNALGESAYHIFPMLLPPDIDRMDFIDRLRAEGVQTSIHYPPVHRFSYYAKRYPGVSLPITESVAQREVTLPLYPTMNGTLVATVISAVRRGLESTRGAKDS